MAKPIPRANCFFCNKSCHVGYGVYEGKMNQTYRIFVCHSCSEGNWDGWAPRHEAKLIAHLKANGMDIPERNEKGWLPHG